ncbi:hypothetical protein P7C73_g6853, partial [Tremellales sp. Uapishka_1]
IIRSASQPGLTRTHVNGITSRSHSPAPSNVSFHGNGHPKRAKAPASVGTNVNNKEKKTNANPQRVPGLNEFPALGNGNEKKSNTQWDGKTAAQVLSQPAPAPPVVAKPKVEVTPAEGEEDASDQSQSVTMDSESDSDAVVISNKTSRPSTSRASVSFASALGAGPVALKA